MNGGGEGLGLRWSDVDLDAGSVTVRQALQRVGKEIHFVEPKSERSRRTVHIATVAIKTLKRHRQMQRGGRLLAGSRWVESGLVFASSIGTPLDERNVRRAFKGILEDAELPNMRLDDLRHTCATLLLGQGVHPRVVMDTLGHSQISLTLDTCSHVLPSLQAEAARQMDQAIGCQIGCQNPEGTSAQADESQIASEKVVTLTFASWNRIREWFTCLDALRRVA